MLLFEQMLKLSKHFAAKHYQLAFRECWIMKIMRCDFVVAVLIQVEWTPVLPHHQELVYSLPNGSLIFYPFSAEKYRHEIHSTIYRQVIPSSILLFVMMLTSVDALALDFKLFPFLNPFQFTLLSDNVFIILFAVQTLCTANYVSSFHFLCAIFYFKKWTNK